MHMNLSELWLLWMERAGSYRAPAGPSFLTDSRVPGAADRAKRVRWERCTAISIRGGLTPTINFGPRPAGTKFWLSLRSRPADAS